MSGVDTLWGFLAIVVVQLFSHLKNKAAAKRAKEEAVAEAEAIAKAAAEAAQNAIVEARKVTAHERDIQFAVLSKEVEVLKATQGDLHTNVMKMLDGLGVVKEDLAFIKGRFTKVKVGP